VSHTNRPQGNPFKEPVFKSIGKVLKGSHASGRIAHSKVENQTGADVERVKALENICPLEYIEMDPGNYECFVNSLFAICWGLCTCIITMNKGNSRFQIASIVVLFLLI